MPVLLASLAEPKASATNSRLVCEHLNKMSSLPEK